MTTYSEAKKALGQMFMDGWTPDAGERGWTEPASGTVWTQAAIDAGFATPYTLDNEEFDPPKGVAWARFTVRGGDRAQETIGQPGARRFGSRTRAFLEVFIKAGEGGTEAVDLLIDKGLSIFEGKRITGTTLRVMQCIPQERGLDRDKRYWSSFIEIVVDYDEQK